MAYEDFLAARNRKDVCLIHRLWYTDTVSDAFPFFYSDTTPMSIIFI